MNNTAPKRKKRTLLYVLICVFVLLIVAAAVKARQKPKGEEVNAEKVQRRTIREMVSASGKIFPETEVKISSDVSGEVVELYVKEGDSVTVGQVLAKIKPDEYQSALEQGQASVSTAQAQRQISSSNVLGSTAQIAQLKASLAQANAQLETMRNTHKRNEQLYKDGGVISTAEFETSLNNLRAAESGVAVAEANLHSSESSLSSAKENVRVSDYGINSANARLKELRTSLQKTIITAPVSGIVSKLNIERGERVLGMLQMTGTEIMRIANLRSMEVQVDVVENDILKVKVGDETDIEVDAYLGRKFKGKVSEISSSASNVGTSGSSLNTDQVANFVVKIRVDPASYIDLVGNGQRYPFRPGMSAAVDIFTHTADSTLTVPLIAVTARDDDKDKKVEASAGAETTSKTANQIKEIVFVVSGDTVAVREVKTGIQGNEFIEILSGVQEGDMIVTGPYSAVSRKLKSGSRIIVTDKKVGDSSKDKAKVEVD